MTAMSPDPAPRGVVPPNNLPVPLPPWARALLWIAPYVAANKQQLFDYFHEIYDALTPDKEPSTWRRFVVTYSDTLSASPADDQQFTFDLVNITGGTTDNTWTDEDFTGVFNALDTMLTGFSSLIASRYNPTLIQAYQMAFRPMGDPKPFQETGPAVWQSNYSRPSTGVSTVPPQGTTTITEMTPSRANWGRVYMPTLGANAYGDNGRLTSAAMSALANGWSAFYNGLASSEFFPVVPLTSIDKVPRRALQTVTNIRIDDVPDVHRSRRFKNPLAHTTLPTESGQITTEDQSSS